MSLFTKIYDPVMGPLEKVYIRPIRTQILKHAYGEVLEIGLGTGANFPFYPDDVQVTGIEPSIDMLHKAKKKINNVKVPIKLHHGQAEDLPFEDESFDTVLATLVLCSVKDLQRSLEEMHRVLKKGGTIILFEHIRLDDPRWIGFVQDVMTPSWRFVCDGCHLNRDTIKEAERLFQFEQIDEYAKQLFVTAIGKKRMV